MSEVEFTKLSSKGQVVIPQDIRDDMKLKPGTPLAVIEKKGVILLKRIEMPKLKKWEEVTRPFRKMARERNLTIRDINKAIDKIRAK